MTTKLEVFNQALNLVGVRRIESLTIDREARYALDSVYDFTAKHCLEQGMWTFAMRTAAPVAAGLPTLNYGFTNAFTVPSDMVHTYLLGSTVSFQPPLEDAVESDGFYLTRAAAVYAKYVSDDVTYGMDLARWTYVFADYAAAELAMRVAFQLTRSDKIVEMAAILAKTRLAQARLTDSMMASTGILPYNALVRRELLAGSNVQEPNPFAGVATNGG